MLSMTSIGLRTTPSTTHGVTQAVLQWRIPAALQVDGTLRVSKVMVAAPLPVFLRGARNKVPLLQATC